MSWQVVWTEPARKDLRRLDERTRERVIQTVLRFSETGQGDLKKLKGHVDEWRLRVGDWRVRLVLDRSSATLQVVRVLPRGRAYRD